MTGKSIAGRVPHKHAEVIKAWANGIEVQYRSFMSNGEWRDLEDGAQPNFFGSAEWRVKPEKVYPVTQMNDGAICSAYYSGGPVKGNREELAAFYRIANAALRHAIDADQVVPMAKVQEVARNLNERRYERAERALLSAGFEDLGGQEWKPPLGKAPHFIEVHDPKRDMAIAVAVRYWLNREDISDAGLRDIIAGVRP